MPVRDVAAVLAVGGFALGALGALTARHRRAAVRIVFAVVLVASSAVLMGLQPDGPGLAGLLAGLVLLAPRVPDRFPIALSVVAITCLAAVAVAVSQDSPTLALLSAIAIIGFPGMTLLARRLGQANDQAERLLIELEGSRAAQAQAAGLAERQRLAREMHDVLAHSLSGLMLQLEGARMLAAEDPSDPRLPAIIERAHHLGKSGLEEARRAIGMLRDDELPGPERLAGLAAQFQEVSGIPCQFTVSGQAYELPSEARLAVYRVAQEALTNITKHACPDRVEMHLGYEPRRTRLTVENFAMGTGTAASGRRRPRLRPDRDARAGRTARRRTHHSDDVRWLPRGVAGAGVSKPIRVLIADDQRVVREGLAMVLGLLPDVEVVGSACDGDEAVALAADLLPDIVLMDLRMPRCDGVEATRLLRDRVPQTTVVVLTTYADDRSVIDALRAGARGYLTKDAGGAEIRHALRQVLDNHAVIDPAVQHHVVDAIATRIAGPGPATALTSSRGSHSPGSRGTVTDRRRHVEQRDRRTARRQRRHRQEPHQPPARQDRRTRPRPSGHLRLSVRTCPAAGTAPLKVPIARAACGGAPGACTPRFRSRPPGIPAGGQAQSPAVARAAQPSPGCADR